MKTKHHIPPIGVRLTQSIELRSGRYRARARWIDPPTRVRRSCSATFDCEEEAQTYLIHLQSETRVAVDPFVSLANYIDEIGDRHLRGLDPTSTTTAYRCGIRVRVLPALGHLPLRALSASTIDKAIDRWELTCSPSTVKNTVAALSRVLDEAARDEIITMNPVKRRAKRRAPVANPPLRSIPTFEEVRKLAAACARAHPVYGDFVLIAALLAARVSEVAGLSTSDIDWDNGVVTIARQHFPGSHGLCMKPTKNRHSRQVPILAPLQSVLRRLYDNRKHDDQPLLRGPRGGVLTSGTIGRATDWNNLVTSLAYPGLRRHDLRHAGATWFANSGAPIHVVSDILGHASIETTKGYLHTDTTELRCAAEQVNQRLADAAAALDFDSRPVDRSGPTRTLQNPSDGAQETQSGTTESIYT